MRIVGFVIVGILCLCIVGIFALMIGGIITAARYPDQVTLGYLPKGTKIIEKLDGGWVVVEMKLDERPVKFLYRQDRHLIKLDDPIVQDTSLIAFDAPGGHFELDLEIHPNMLNGDEPYVNQDRPNRILLRTDEPGKHYMWVKLRPVIVKKEK
jgi:hypothetical protein